MQSNGARVGLAALLVAAAVVLFIVLQDDDSGDESSGTASQPTATTGGGGGANEGGKAQKPAIPSIVVKNGAPVGGVEKIDVTSGDQVRFRVTSDEPGEVHVHGYDIEKPIQPGKPVALTFPADIQGGYEIELHGEESGEFQIADLAVNPG